MLPDSGMDAGNSKVSCTVIPTLIVEDPIVPRSTGLELAHPRAMRDVMARNEVRFRLLSFSTGLSPAHLCRVASGERRASTASALLIAKALGVAPESCGPGRSERPSRLCTEVDNPVTADASPGDVADTPAADSDDATNDRGFEFTVERFMRSAKSSGLMPDCGSDVIAAASLLARSRDGYIEGTLVEAS